MWLCHCSKVHGEIRRGAWTWAKQMVKYYNKWVCIYLYEVVYSTGRAIHFRQVGSNYWESSELNLQASREGIRLKKSSAQLWHLFLSLTLPYFMLFFYDSPYCLLYFHFVCSSFYVLSFLCCFSQDFPIYALLFALPPNTFSLPLYLIPIDSVTSDFISNAFYY